MTEWPRGGPDLPRHAGPDAAVLPRHVAIIMDGNGRWARRRGLPRSFGHRQGVEAVRRIVRHAGERRIKCLTLFAFSKENWSRPAGEVAELMSLLRRYLKSDLTELVEKGVKVRVIGGRAGLDPDIRETIESAEARTAHNEEMELVLAFNYSGRDEIVRAARRAALAVAAGEVSADGLDEAAFARLLDTGTLPDPDLVIRTSGERRISNFLLWQSAYAEYAFPDTLWPDFSPREFDEALADYATRQRRFGAVPVEVANR